MHLQSRLCLLPVLILHLAVRAFGATGRGPEASAWSYAPSPLELTWLHNVSKWDKDYCTHVPEFKDNITYWLATTKKLMLTARYRLPEDDGGGVFSLFNKLTSCGEHSHKYSTWIEPLAMCLRHPEAPCNDDESQLESREYLLLSSVIDVQQENCGRSHQSYFFDIGASVWAHGASGASQKMLVDAYAKRGIHFDRIICWEAGANSVEDIYKDVPKDLLGKYTYYNFPVTSDATLAENPVNILKRITTTTDFVALKLDIDYSPVENELIHQILADPEIYSRIDEFFFEHHVNFEPMASRYWGAQENETYTLEYSYQIFTALRERGIRAHGWP